MEMEFPPLIDFFLIISWVSNRSHMSSYSSPHGCPNDKTGKVFGHPSEISRRLAPWFCTAKSGGRSSKTRERSWKFERSFQISWLFLSFLPSFAEWWIDDLMISVPEKLLEAKLGAARPAKVGFIILNGDGTVGPSIIYPPALWESNMATGKSLENLGLNGKINYESWIFQCHLKPPARNSEIPRASMPSTLQRKLRAPKYIYS